jgi:hypothetical protein
MAASTVWNPTRRTRLASLVCQGRDARRQRPGFNNRIDPRVVVGEHGWWQACAELDAPGYDPFGPTGANLNLIIGGAVLDPVSGTASHRAYLCEIRRGA